MFCKLMCLVLFLVSFCFLLFPASFFVIFFFSFVSQNFCLDHILFWAGGGSVHLSWHLCIKIFFFDWTRNCRLNSTRAVVVMASVHQIFPVPFVQYCGKIVLIFKLLLWKLLQVTSLTWIEQGSDVCYLQVEVLRACAPFTCSFPLHGICWSIY